MKVDAARQAAFDVVLAVETQDTYANLALPTVLRERGLSGRDAAFATELTYGTLRLVGRYDAIVSKAAKRSARDLDVEVLVALRLGAHQALGMRVPPHAAVSETVDLVRLHRGKGASGFANAVMRRIVEADLDTWLSRVAPGTSRSSLGVKHSHPEWMVGELDRALIADGRPGQLEALLEADNQPPAVTLVARPGLVSRDAVAQDAPGAVDGSWSPYALILESGDPGDIAAVARGEAAVQDEGSQLAALALLHADAALNQDGGQPPQRWLDMCAGPGGKAALVGAQVALDGGALDALELHPHRAGLVKDSVRAVPEGVVSVHAVDARAWGEPASYDRIMVDAPCTGLGALRRRPEARWRRSPRDLDELVEIQTQLLAQALRLVKPGGAVAYVTCSPVVAETRAVVEDAGAVLLDTRLAVAAATGTEPADWGPGPHVQLWPHVHGTDAMFIQLLTVG